MITCVKSQDKSVSVFLEDLSRNLEEELDVLLSAVETINKGTKKHKIIYLVYLILHQ